MPLSGGAADKIGNRYEGRWTVSCMLDVLDEMAESIRLEPPGMEGEGVEFWLKRVGQPEYHQVKTGPRWTVSDIAKAGVFPHFASRLANPNARCVFVTNNSAGELAELTHRARSAASWDEYDQSFLGKDNGEWRLRFNRFKHSLGDMTDEDAHNYLRRIDVASADEKTLHRWNESRAFTLVEGNALVVIDALAAIAADHVNQELTAHDIWRELESRDLRRRRWDKDPHVLSAIERTNKRYVRHLRKQAILGSVLPQDEFSLLTDILLEPDGASRVMVTGEAGVGKSGVMLQVVEKLLEDGVPIIAFRVDSLSQTELPDNVGAEVGLPGSPTNVLASIAQGKDCVLVIDQLDAISLASGRNTMLFDCVAEILHQARAHPKMRVVLVCRKFDLDNDHRLKSLVNPPERAVTVAVERLKPDIVRQVVSGFGLQGDLLNDRQVDLLSVPLHLKLLSQIVSDEKIRSLDFKTSLDLYGHFWRVKQSTIEKERLERKVSWTKVIYALCDYMHKNQTLTAPDYLVEDWATDADAMASENVLVREDRLYAFFHEGFFDYAYARRFARSDQTITNLLLSGEQHLFRRSQTRQILGYLRVADFPRYIDDLRRILSSSDIRFHIKQVTLALLAEVQNPRDEELAVLSQFLRGSLRDPVEQQAWMTIRQSSAMFQLAVDSGLLNKWLESTNDSVVDQSVLLLSVKQRHFPDRIAELLECYVGKSERWNQRLAQMAWRANWGISRRFLKLMLRLIDEGYLDDARRPGPDSKDFWLLARGLSDAHPEWASEVTGHFLKRRLDLSLNEDESNPFAYETGNIAHGQFANEVLEECANEAPESFVRELMPFLQEVIQRNIGTEQNGFRIDKIWRNRIFRATHNFQSALLNALLIALSHLAAKQPNLYSFVVESLRTSTSETIQYLLLSSMASGGTRFADKSIDHLCDNPGALQIGYSSHPYWVARQLIEAASPHCSTMKLEELELLLLGYYPDWERSTIRRNAFGSAQFTLLSAIPADRRSERVRKRLAELQRKFAGGEPSPPSEMRARRVRSPIPKEAIDHMTDDQWLSAIAKHSGDSRIVEYCEDIIGGAAQLSGDLEGKAVLEPQRFADLVARFPQDTNPEYFRAVLRGLCSAGADVNAIAGVSELCHSLEGKPFGVNICDAVAGAGPQNIPQDLIELVAWYAMEDPNPNPMEEPSNAVFSVIGEPTFQTDILSSGFNTVRGRAAYAVARLLFEDYKRITYLRQTLETMVDDPSIAVRACVAEALLVVFDNDEVLAVDLFLKLCDTDEELLPTHHVERFLLFALPSHFRELSPILQRMIQSDDPEVSLAGARQACLVALELCEAVNLTTICRSGTEAQRIGAAQVFSSNIRFTPNRRICEDSLVVLLNDENPEVQSYASSCFDRFEGADLEDFPALIEAFVKSQAFSENCSYLFQALQQATGILDKAILLASEKFVEKLGMEAGDLGSRKSREALTVIKLTLRAYHHSTTDNDQTRSLDLIDRLLEYGVYGAEDELESFER